MSYTPWAKIQSGMQQEKLLTSKYMRYYSFLIIWASNLGVIEFKMKVGPWLYLGYFSETKEKPFQRKANVILFLSQNLGASGGSTPGTRKA